MKKLLEVKDWSLKFYLVTGAILLSINLFGPKGIVHWVLLDQEKNRISMAVKALDDDLRASQKEVMEFQKSDIAKERAIREHLGYLKNDEVSVEILSSSKRE